MAPVTKRMPLFQLPYLVLKAVSMHMNPVEIMRVSMCSKKAESIMKTLKINIHEQYLLDVHFRIRPQINFINCRTQEKLLFENLPLKSLAILPSKIESVFEIFGRLKIEATFLIDDYVYNEMVFEWAKAHRKLILNALIFDGITERMHRGEVVCELMGVLKNCKTLKIDLDFEFEFRGQLEVDELIVANDKWLTMSNLWKFQVKEIFIVCSARNFNNMQINRFMRTWQRGTRSNPYLRKISFKSKAMHVHSILHRMQFQEVDFRADTKTYQVLNDVDGTEAYVTKESNKSVVNIIF